MLTKLRARLSYANVVSTLCLFVLLGGSAYAVTQLDRDSVKSVHIVDDQVKGADVDEESLRRICPDSMRRLNDLCFERSDRAPLAWENALRECAAADFRLPTLAETVLIISNVNLPVNTEVTYWTSEWEPQDGTATSIVAYNSGGQQVFSLVRATKANAYAYKCVTSAR